MVTVAVAVFVVSVTEVAMIVTEPVDPGAVYVVAAPLVVLVGLNDPQLFAGMQLHDTPAFVESFVTVAVNWAVCPAVTEVGGLLSATEIAAGVLELAEVEELGDDDVLLPQPSRHIRAISMNPISRVSRLSFIRGLPLPEEANSWR